jgi:hypothetical protein
LINECLKRGIKPRIYSLYNKNKEYTNDGVFALHQHIKEGYQPDIVFHMDYGVYDHPLLDKKYFNNSFTIMEAGDDPQRFADNYRKVHKFDVILTPDKVSLNQYKSNGINAIYWTHFADAIHGVENPDINPIYDVVCTRGDGNTAFLDQIKNKIGERFSNKRDFNLLQRDLLCTGKIIIQNSKFKEVTRRLFEGMLCNRLVLTDRLPEYRGIDELFIENEDIVYYDNLDDAIEKIDFYSNNEEDRKRIAFNGFNKVKNNHTTIQRLDDVLFLYNTRKK